MKEKCPGLPNWEALKDEACAEAFSTAETAPKGRYLGGPVTWGGFDDERVEALELPFEVVHAGTDAALFAELESPISARRRSCCGSMRRTGHRPSTRASGWNSRNTPRNATRPGWGSNPDAAAYDCGKPRGEIWKVGWSGVKDKWPGAHKAIQAFTIDNDEMGAMITEVDLNGKKLEDVVSRLGEQEVKAAGRTGWEVVGLPTAGSFQPERHWSPPDNGLAGTVAAHQRSFPTRMPTSAPQWQRRSQARLPSGNCSAQAPRDILR
jgi:hypothetical protein